MNESRLPAGKASPAEGTPPGESARPDTGQRGVNDLLVLRLRDLSHTLRALYEGRGSQKRVLIVLSRMGGSVTQRELTDRLGVSPASASEVIGKLEAAGCIRRTTNEADRRNVDVVLTGQGQKMAEEAELQREHRHERMFSCLSAEEKASLLSLLERVEAHWTEEFGDPGGSNRPCLRSRQDCGNQNREGGV